MATTKDHLVEVHDGVEYELEPTHYKSKCVGFAPTRSFDSDEEMLEHYGLSDLCAAAGRQKKQDAKNAVRGKYNKDKVSATTIINAQKTGEMTTEMFIAAKKDYDANKYDHNWTKCCSVQLGIGDDALDKADATHKHWDCAR